MSKKHMLIMLACCILPVIALGLVYVFNVPQNSIIWGAMLLLCPISHLLMMKFMGQDHEGHHSAQNPTNMLKDSSHTHHEG